MNQDIQNKIKVYAEKKYVEPEIGVSFRHYWAERAAFIAGANHVLSSPEIMKEAITEAFDWITRSGYDVAGKDVWMAVYGPADDDREFTSAQLVDKYIDHLKQKACIQ